MGVRVGRLTRRPDYLRVAATRRRAVTPTLILQMADSGVGAEEPARVGFTASKKVGNAVCRNRARRRLKAAARIILPVHAAAGRDYVAIAREATVDAPWDRITADWQSALRKLGAWRADAPEGGQDCPQGSPPGGQSCPPAIPTGGQDGPPASSASGQNCPPAGAEGGQKCPA